MQAISAKIQTMSGTSSSMASNPSGCVRGSGVLIAASPVGVFGCQQSAHVARPTVLVNRPQLGQGVRSSVAEAVLRSDRPLGSRTRDRDGLSGVSGSLISRHAS
jgi:hypothetical protein